MKTKKRYQDMSAAELAMATREFDEPDLTVGQPMSKKDRQWFDAWQKKSLTREAQRKHERVTFLLPRNLASQLGELARQKHTTPALLAKRIVQEAIHQAVA